MIRVLIVEDSSVAAQILAGIMTSDPEITVVGTARNGIEALEMTPRLAPDLITMDVWMPQMDGFATVEQIMAYFPTPILVITASLARQDVNISLTMLAAGALDVIEKPSRLDEDTWQKQSRELIRKVKTLARVRVVTHLRGRRLQNRGVMPPPAPQGAPPPRPPSPPPPAPTPQPPDRPRRRGSTGGLGRRGLTGPLSGLLPHPPPQRGVNRFSVLAVASSTGGPQALLALLKALPPDFPLPILVVQHIAVGFTAGLTDWLGQSTGRPVALAREGATPAPGAVLLAPDNRHLLLGPGGRVRLDDGPPHTIRPAADLLFRSVANVYSQRAIGVILTGMGRDGAEGLKALRLAGGTTVAQDEATSLIFGMPRAAISLGIVDTVLPLMQIPAHLAALVAGEV